MTPGPTSPAAAIGAPHHAEVWQSASVLLENGRGFVGRSVVDHHPGRWLHRLRRHAVERAAEVLGLVPARRDEQIASRVVHLRSSLEEVSIGARRAYRCRPKHPGGGCTRPAETGDRMLFRGLQLRRIRPLLAAPSTACRLIHRRRGDHCLQLRHHRPAQVTADTSSIIVRYADPDFPRHSLTEELPGWTAAGVVGGNLIQLAPGTQPG